MSAENQWIWNKVIALAKKASFSACGCTKATEVSETDIIHYNERLNKGYFANMSYLERNCEKRFNPSVLVEGTKSILIFLAPFGENKYIRERGANLHYNNNTAYCELPHESEQLQQHEPAKERISQYAMGEDYHKVIKDKLYGILKTLQEEDQSIKGRPFVDSAPVLERYWAAKAGIGFIGKNNFLISPECGIRNFIGVLYLNKELPSGTATFFTEKGTIKAIAQIYCGECDRCIKACPTGALEAPYTLNANKCTSYLTIEAAHWKNTETGVQKGAINRFDLLSMPNKIQAVNGWLFGCDECMNACPWNSRNRPSWREFLKAKRD